MTVSQLIEQLQTLPQDLEVIIGKDSLNDDFSPLDDFVLAEYQPDNSWSGLATYQSDFDDNNKVNAIILFPIN